MSKIVLIVDDSMVSRMMVKEIVKTHIPDVQIIEAGSGQLALELINVDSHIDIALIDFNMPGMTGIELLEKLEGIINIPKRALLTANIQDEVKNKAESAGVTFLNKPIVEDVIANFIQN
jgi:two-component system, chemotaxis family, chemotaxis protein CheY